MSNFIENIGCYCPKNRIDLKKEFKDDGIDEVIKKTGVEYIQQADDDECVVKMAKEASLPLINKLKEEDKPDTIIFCTQTSDFQIPQSSAILQNELNLPLSTKTFDINLGCSGYPYGLMIAYSMLNANLSKSILFVTADTYSKIINKDDKKSAFLFSDRACATLLKKSDKNYRKKR